MGGKQLFSHPRICRYRGIAARQKQRRRFRPGHQVRHYGKVTTENAINMNFRRLLPLFLSLLLLTQFCFALQKQSNADYRARREALAKKLSDGVMVLFAPMEA